MENKEEGRKISLSKTKHLELYIIAFVVTVAVAAVLITCSALGVFTNFAGYAELETAAYSDVKFTHDIHCYIYFKGNDMQVSSKKRKASSLFSTLYREIYMMTDPYVDYSPYSVSLKQINRSLGEDVKVDERLYLLLKDAYEKSDPQNNNYSIFAATLYHEWDSLLYFGALGDYESDPLFDEEEANYLSELASMINNPSNYSLEFKENNVVNLNISNEYKEFLETYDNTSPIISLNVLESAYQMQYIANKLEEVGYTNGYLVDDFGNGLTLKGFTSLNHNLYDIQDGEAHLFGHITQSDKYCFSATHHFLVNPLNAPYFYDVNKDDKIYHRSSYIKLEDGGVYDKYLSTNLFSKTLDLPSLVLENNKLPIVDNSYLAEQGDRYMFLLVNNSVEKRITVHHDFNEFTIYKNEYIFDTI